MFEREAHETPLKSFSIPSKERTEELTNRVKDLDGGEWYVSDALYNRIKASMSKGVDRPKIRTEDGSISGLYTPSQVGYLGYSTDGESAEKQEENASEEKNKNKGVSNWVDST